MASLRKESGLGKSKIDNFLNVLENKIREVESTSKEPSFQK